MANEGPTTAATLVAKFRGDDTDVMEAFSRVRAAATELGATDTEVDIKTAGGSRAIADMQRVQATAVKVGSLSPDVSVRATVTDAVAKLSAVEAAQERLSFSTDRLKLAYTRLDEVNATGTAKQSTLMAAHLAAAKAEQAHAQAVRALTDAQVEEAAASEAEAVATQKVGDAAGDARPRTIAMAGAIAGVISLLGPLAAGATAGAGGFLGLGAAGVLAILGIKKEMQDGTRVGNQYSAGLGELNTYLDQLEHSAAVGFLGSFQQVEEDIAAGMPQLNSEVQQFTGILGQSAEVFVPALIDALDTLNPLFVHGAEWVTRMGQSFADWEKSGGLEKFVQYAQRELPQVEKTVETLTKATLDLGQAWAPMGDTLMQVAQAGGHVITWYSDITKWIDSLQPKLSTGSKDWDNFIGGVLGGITGLGVAQGGLNFFTTTINTLSGATDEGTMSTDAHTAAVDRAKKAVESTAATYGISVSAYKALQDSQKQSADQLKATTSQMRFQNDAAGLLKNALDILNGKTLDLEEAQTGFAASNNSLVDSLKNNKKVVDGNSEAAVANRQALQQSVEAAQQYAEAVGTSTGSSEKARQALVDSKTQMEDTLRSQGLLTDGVQAYIDKIFGIPTVVSTQVDIDTAVAMLKVQALAAEIVKLGNQYAKATASRTVTSTSTAAGFATGGTIGVQRLAAGGPSGTVFGPGSGTSDSIPTWLSAGEEVIKASSAQRVRPLLQAINRDPEQAVNGLVGKGVAAGAAVAQAPIDRSNHLHIHETGWSPAAVFSEYTRRLNARNA